MIPNDTHFVEFRRTPEAPWSDTLPMTEDDAYAYAGLMRDDGYAEVIVQQRTDPESDD